MTPFREVQRPAGRQLALLVFEVVLWVGLVVTWPLGGVLGLAAAGLVALLAGLLASALWMSVNVFDDRVEVRGGGWLLRKRVAVGDIVSSETFEWDVLTKGSLSYARRQPVRVYRPGNGAGCLKGVLVTMADGTAIFIVSGRPEELLQAIEAARQACDRDERAGIGAFAEPQGAERIH